MLFSGNRHPGVTLPGMLPFLLQARLRVRMVLVQLTRLLSMHRPECKARRQQTIHPSPDGQRRQRITQGLMNLGISEEASLALLHRVSMEPQKCQRGMERLVRILCAARRCPHTMTEEISRDDYRQEVYHPGQVANLERIMADLGGQWKWAAAHLQVSPISALGGRS